MSDIAKRLLASLRFDAVNGDQHERSVVASQMREAASHIATLEAELAAVRADAERYLWLRDEAHQASRHAPAVLKDGPTDECSFYFGNELDAAIDAARKE